MTWFKTPLAKGILGGFIGMVAALIIGLVGVHLYQDHQGLHVVFQMITNAQQQKAPPK